MSNYRVPGGPRGAFLLAAVAALTPSCREPVAAMRVRESTGAIAGACPESARCPVLPPADGGPVSIDCPIFSCGNSAKIYGSEIEALDTSGEEAQWDLIDPFRLVRGSLVRAGGGCRGVPGLSLEVRRGGFVGVTGGPPSGDPAIVACAGEELEGARFELESTLTGERVTIEIAEVDEVATWEKASPARVPVYDMLVHEAPRPGLPAPRIKHLCPGSEREPDTRALLMQGETYGRDGAVAAAGPDWFNIACAGSALSKLRLLGFDPMNGRSTVEERQATLKMLTGKYCDEWSRTREGTSIYPLRHGGGVGAPGTVDLGDALAPERVGPIESRWGAGGALCLSHLRLWSPADTCSQLREDQWAAYIRHVCNIPACDEALPCSAGPAGVDGATIWTTCTIDHVSHAGP